MSNSSLRSTLISTAIPDEKLKRMGHLTAFVFVEGPDTISKSAYFTMRVYLSRITSMIDAVEVDLIETVFHD